MDKIYLVIESSGEYGDFRRHACLAAPFQIEEIPYLEETLDANLS